MNQHKIIGFVTAKLAHEKKYKTSEYFGYDLDGNLHSQIGDEDWITFGYDENFYLAPTREDLQSWLRVNHKIDVIPTMSQFSRTYGYKIYYISEGKTEEINNRYIKEDSYNNALELGLLQALKLIDIKQGKL